MKRYLYLIGTILIVTLIAIFSFRVSPDAMAVVIGVILGVAASVPTTALFVFILTRQQHKQLSTPNPPSQPPVFVINASDKPQSYPPPAFPMLSPPTENGRKWNIIGDTET
jgi:hypothetical protein